MIPILIIVCIIFFIEILVVGIIFSRAIIEFNNFNIIYDETNSKKFKINEFEISAKIYFFKYIKVLSVKVYKEYIKIFNIKIKIELLKKFKIIEENYKKIYIDFKLLIKNKNEINFKLLKPQIYSFNFEFEIGTISQMFTTFIIPTVSTSIAIILNKLVKKINPDDYNFKISPKYSNKNFLKIKFDSKISFSVIKLIFFILKLKNIVLNNKIRNELVIVKKHNKKEFDFNKN